MCDLLVNTHHKQINIPPKGGLVSARGGLLVDDIIIVFQGGHFVNKVYFRQISKIYSKHE